MKTAHPKEDYLVNLRKKWLQDPDQYKDEVHENLRAISFSTLSRMKLPKYRYEALEDEDDFKNDLLLHMWRKWTHNIEENTTNKRLFNYMKQQVYYFVQTKNQETQKRFKKEGSIKNHVFGHQSKLAESISDFPIDPEVKELASRVLDKLGDQKIIHKFSKKDHESVRNELGWTESHYDNVLKKLKENYMDQRSPDEKVIDFMSKAPNYGREIKITWSPKPTCVIECGELSMNLTSSLPAVPYVTKPDGTKKGTLSWESYFTDEYEGLLNTVVEYGKSYQFSVVVQKEDV